MTTPAAPLIRDPLGDHSTANDIGFDKTRHPNAAAILFDNLQRDASAIALTGPAGDMSYRALCDAALKWRSAFESRACNPAERIALFMDDTPALVAAFFGALHGGFVPVLLNTLTGPDLLNYYLMDMDARIAVCEAAFAGCFNAEALSGTRLETVIIANGEAATSAPHTVTAEAALPDSASDRSFAPTGPDDMAFWMYSSGSTGRPKGIVHLHHDMAYTVASYADHILKLTPGDICFSVPKIFFAYGLGNSVTFPLAAGATSLLMPGQPKPDILFGAIRTYRPTVFFGLPTLYTALARADSAADADLSSLRLCVSAAETLSAEIAEAWQDLSGMVPVEGLGSTELLHIYLSNTPGARKLGSAGRQVPGYEIALRDPDGQPVARGSEGTLWVRGHSSAPCYWNRPDKTAETMRDDWICTGDIFTEDADGFLFFHGRTDDLVKVSGQWVYPLEVEHCLTEHPDVHECAVLAHALADGRTSLRAFVTLKEGTGNDAVTRRLQDFVKARLLPHKYPRSVIYLQDLPKTGTGKIDRQALKQIPTG